MYYIQKNKTVLSLIFFIVLMLVLSLVAQSGVFLIVAFLYPLIQLIVSKGISSDKRSSFLNITCLFLFVYSSLVIVTHYVFIHNVHLDFFVGVDESKFLGSALDLSKFSYTELWNIAFEEFRYSDSPLTYAWMGMLAKFAHLSPFYCLLFLKLNSAFLGSFVTGVVYLLLCRCTNREKAYRSAIAYGVFSFTFFYAIGLMRDIHIALIYVIGLYIISGANYSVRNYLVLAILGILAFFIRIENGLFFIAFLGAWMLKNKTKYKVIVVSISLLIFIGVLFLLGGVSTIFNTAKYTTTSYEARGIAAASSESFGVLLNRLPIPFNYLSKTAFGQMQPFPFWFPFSLYGNTFFQKIFYIFPAMAGIFWFAVWFKILTNLKMMRPFLKQYKWLTTLAILYIVLNSMGEFNPRRMMAVYPVIFMGLCSIQGQLFNIKDWIKISLIYCILIVMYLILQIVY